MKGIRAFALAGVSFLSVAAPAFAQDQVAKDSDEVGLSGNEIVVSARRREESLQDVPLVVNAVTADTLDKLNIREFKDVATLVPGLQLGQSQNGIGAQATLRGVAYDVNASGNNGTIEFYLNEAHISAGQLFISMYDVGQIEVLRGPQGTLRGRASPSGSITVSTRKPVLDQAGGYLNGFVNDIHGWNLNGAINVPIIEDKLAIRVAGVMDQNQENRVRSINNPLDPHQETQSGRITVRAEPFDFLSLNGSYTRTKRKSRSFYQFESANLRDPSLPASPVLIQADDRLSVMQFPAKYEQDYEIWNWSAQLRLAGQKLDYVGANNKQHFISGGPADTGSFFSAAFPLALRTAGQSTDSRGSETTHEFRLSNEERIGGMFDYVVGYFYDKLDSPTALIQQTPVFLGLPGPTTPITVVNTPISRGGGSVEKSFFGNVTAHIGDQLEISGGLRHIKYHSTGFLTIAGTAVAAAAEDRRINATIYSASATYRVTPDLMIYASTGSSWRPGSSTNPTIFREIANPSPLLSSYYFPAPETSKSYEIGFKSEWLDKRLRFNVTAYHQDFKNYAYSSRNVFIAANRANGAPNVFTAGPAIAVGVPAKVDGIEGEIGYRITDRFDIGVTASYALSKIKNGRIPCNDYSPRDGVPDTSGAVPTYTAIQTANGGEQIAVCAVNYRAGVAAPFSATVQSEFSQPVGFGDAYVRGLFSYQGDSQNDPANAFDDIKAYGLLNLYAGIRSADGSWDVGIYGKNITNVGRVLTTKATPDTVSYQIGATGANGVSTYRQVQLYTNPREFGVNFTVRFGSR
ncbi:TonB-dependent receptor [Novosphingobium sp. JCM 18896]|uniref:TonB-dependent receptor n=1 Tax=Novosphingobium sp. JCM 18896 TaxID=2989731 RepID=UPI002222849A|nr:TonB-dependent receptor [Novosphingobium sp. JCM 18896]MCW1431169.1 TonB-dependent receptor [Novosphingobium sp. JCM 18896]